MRDVHVLITVKPEYTEEFFVAMEAFKSLYNHAYQAHPSKNLVQIEEVYYTVGPCDFLVKIRGKDEKITETIVQIRETLGSAIKETLTVKKFKIPMTKEELENMFEKMIEEKSIAKLPPYMDGEKIPDECYESGDEIDLNEIYDAETTPLKKLVKKAKKIGEPEELKEEIDKLKKRVGELEEKWKK